VPRRFRQVLIAAVARRRGQRCDTIRRAFRVLSDRATDPCVLVLIHLIRSCTHPPTDRPSIHRSDRIIGPLSDADTARDSDRASRRGVIVRTDRLLMSVRTTAYHDLRFFRPTDERVSKCRSVVELTTLQPRGRRVAAAAIWVTSRSFARWPDRVPRCEFHR
jgi:hypothetical protein